MTVFDLSRTCIISKVPQSPYLSQKKMEAMGIEPMTSRV